MYIVTCTVLIALPARQGGLGIPIPTRAASRQFTGSMEITAPLVGLIAQKSPQYSAVAQARQKEAKAAVRRRNLANNTEEADALIPKLTKIKQMAMEQASEKGASSWLTTIPVLRYGYNLNNQAFRDALCLIFGWTPRRLPQHCPCGHPFSVDHALSCPKGACLLFDITPSGISQLNSSQKFVQILALSPHFNP